MSRQEGVLEPFTAESGARRSAQHDEAAEGHLSLDDAATPVNLRLCNAPQSAIETFKEEIWNA
ncbi:MAG TPA: hypothetical protein VEF92_01590 [Burkholderiales bacterium]|nr:hypothetical protein [Burkholderiales bacterium]HYA46219.1 hypothetical protein [Burkholderiales bacterium]